MRQIIIILISFSFSFSCLGQVKAPKNNKDLDKMAEYLVDLIKENNPEKLSYFEYSEKDGNYIIETCENDENQMARKCINLKRDIGTNRTMFTKTYKNVIGTGQILGSEKLKSMEITKVDQNFCVPSDFEIHKVKILFTIGDEKGEIAINNVVKTKKGWFFIGDASFTVF